MALQITSGILSFFYNSDTNHAFVAVENIMRNIKYG
jgi:quinol-cytochrome oxidoreductase complex cytochrome b subunit